MYALANDHEKMKYMLKFANNAIIKGLAALRNCNIDMLGDTKLNLQLEEVDFRDCKFTSSKQMEGFLKSLEGSKVLTVLRLEDLEFLNKSTVWSSSLANVVKACPIKYLELYIYNNF